ncbi:MAG: response regulator [Ktedonobacteraceae bacterium]
MYFAPKANYTSAKTILIVEDDEDIGYLLVQIIHQQTSHLAIHHINARNALDAIAKLTPHLYILDYSLPDMNGLELHDWLQSIERLKHAPTILMSARNPPLEEIRKRGILLIRKPFAVTRLLENIENLLA